MLISTPVFIGLLLPPLLASPISEQGVSVFPDLDDKLFKNEERTHDPSFPLSFKLSHFPNIGEHLKPEENSLLKKGGSSFRKPLEFDDFLVDSLENEAEPSQIVENGDDSKNPTYDDFDEQITSEEVSKKKPLHPDYEERHAENEESSGSLEDEEEPEEEGYSVEESRASRGNQSEKYSGELKNPKCEGSSCEAPDYDNNSAEQETDYEENGSQSTDSNESDEENEEDPSSPVASQEDERSGDRGKGFHEDAGKTAANHSETISKPVVYLQKQKSLVSESATKRSSQVHRLAEPESSQVEAEDISIDSFELNPDVMKPPPSSGEEQQSIEPTRSDESVEQRHGTTETLSQAKKVEETTDHLRLRPSPPPTLRLAEPGGTLVRRIVRPPPPPTRPGPLHLHPHQTHLYTQVESPTRASGNWNAMMAARQATALTYLKPPPLGQPQTWAVRRHIPLPIYQILPEEVFEEKEEEKSFYNIAVTVIEANQVSWQNMETRVCVQLGKDKKLTRIKESSERPYYNEYFVFDFEGSLESLMDKIMVISIVHPRHRLRRSKTLGSARLDLGTIWIQPGHEIRDKWILLTDPSDPTGRVKGYISCEVGIIPPGGKLSAKIKTEPVKELFIPESQGAGRLKAKYMFRVHRGENFSLKTADKKFSSFVLIYFAGLSGQTTHRKYSHHPLWNEEIVFTELFPPLYNRVRFDVHLGKSIVYTKYLNLSDISDPAVKGFLPMYGPSFIYLYSPPYRYMGSLLVSLETKTVLAFSEHEKLLAVKRQKCPELLEKLFWNTADFVVFGIVYEVSMLDKRTRRNGPLLLRLGFGDSESRELTDDNLFESWEDQVHVQDKNYSCLPRTRVKQTLYTRKELPDIRGRPYLSNRLAKAASSFGRELLKTQFLLDNRPELGTPRLWAALRNLKQQCHILKTGFEVGPTPLDKERFKTVIAKINALILSINQIPPSESLIGRFEKAVEIYKEMLKLVQDPQETLPLIILQLASHQRVLAYVRIRPRDILYSSKESEKGINCGSVQTLFLKSSSRKGGFGGKLDILLWLGPFQSVGLGLAGVPTGYQDMSTLRSFPRAIIYSEGAVFTCRAHIYQGQFVPCEDAEGSCSLSVKVFFGARNVESTIKKALCPIWSETLTIQSVTIYGSAEDNKKHPRKIVIEVWNHSGDKKLVGRVVARPHVFLTSDRLQPPDYPPPLEWIRIHSAGRIKGELLAMFELLQEREQRIFVEDEVEPEVRDDLMKTPVGIPDYIKPSTVRYRLEVLFWGVRGTKDFRLSSINNPRMVIDCGPIQISSLVLRHASSFPNFVQTPLSMDINLPADWSFAPPLIVRMFDSRSFGTKAFIGSHTFRSLRNFVVHLPRKEDWMKMRSGQKVDVVDTFQYDDEEYQRRKSLPLSEYITSETQSQILESEPLVELKQDVPPKPPPLIWPTRRLFKSFFGINRKAKSENLISLALLPSGFDPESDENFFDWWTKYYESLNRHTEKEPNSHEDKVKNHKKKKTPGIRIYSSELENQPEFEGFQDVLKNITIFHEPIIDEKRKAAVFKGGVSLYRLPVEDFITTGGWSAEHGIYSSVMTEAKAIVHILIRVYVIRAYRLHTKDRFGTVDPFIEVSIPSQTVSDVKNYVRQESNPIFGKCYELQARIPYDSILRVRVMDHDRFSSAELVGETSIDIENRYYSRHRGTCGLQQSYDTEGYNRWRDAYKPSETLEWLCLSYNFPPPIYTSTSVTVTTRKFGCKGGPSKDAEHRKQCLALSALLHWADIPLVGCKLVEEHVETRSLYNSEQPGIEQGKLEMWVDLLPRQTLELPPQVVVEPRRPDKYQLRAIVWSTHKVILVDRGVMVGKRHTDIYVKGWLKGREDLQQTDVHYASLTGEGLFNWRFIFNFSYLREENMIVLDDHKDADLRSNKIPPVLYFQLWDLERFKKDDFLGAISLKLHNIPPPSQKVPWSQKYLPLKGWTLNLFKVRKVRGAWPFTGSRQGKPPQTVGMLDLELTLMTAEEAERTPAGQGRSEPSALPEPIRPVVKYTMWIAPFRAIKNYLCRYHKKHMSRPAGHLIVAVLQSVVEVAGHVPLQPYSGSGGQHPSEEAMRDTSVSSDYALMRSGAIMWKIGILKHNEGALNMINVELLMDGNKVDLNNSSSNNHYMVAGEKWTEVKPPIEGEVCLLTESPFRILRAAESGNLEDFNRLFMAEPERLGVRDSKGRAAAHQAAARNKLNILQFIANHGGDLNIRDHHGNTPLLVAVEHECVEAIDFLFQFGVDPNLLNDKKQSVIHLATELNKVKVLQAMTSYKDRIEVNLGGEHERTALHLAAIYDHDDCARVLIKELGACPRRPCNNGYYPIHEAAKNASSKTMEVFLQWGEERGCPREEMISFYDSEGNVPLHSAVHSGDFKAVELCLSSGAKISTQQHDLSTPVHLACAQGALDIVKLMFRMQPAEKPLCLSSCDVQKMTPLHCAAMFDRAEIVQYLVAEGADINALDKEKRSPLLLAGSRGGWRTVLALIRLKANIQLKDSNDRNVLHLVVMNGGRLDEFADAVIKAQSRQRLQELLNEKDRTGCSPLHHASREGHIRSLENLIKLGAVINLKNNNNESPLHFAARYGRYNTVKQLLDSEKGSFIINETDGEGLTPLHIASQQGHTRVVALLLNRGALLHRDHNGRNPLHLAAMSGYTQTMELLHSVHSHLLDQTDKDGNTGLHLATMENKPNSIALLLSINCKLLYNNIDLSAIDYAIYYKFPEAALAMVTHDTRGAEVMSLRSDKHPCVTLALIAAMPRVFESVQDKCITKANCKKDSKSFYIKYSFSCLQCPRTHPPSLHDSKMGETFTQQAPIPLPALNAMVQHGRVELLAHPLSQKYLQMKWNSYGKYVHMAYLLFYLIFLVFVTLFSSHIMSQEAEACHQGNYSTVLVQSCTTKFNTTLEYVCATGILLYVSVMTLRELVQLFQQRWQYLLDPTNLVSWLLNLSALFMVMPLSEETKQQVQVPCAALTVFLTWFHLLLNLQRFDLVGIYVVMFLEILQTLIKVLVVFSILIIAFGLAFFILLSRGGHVSFSSVPMSLMRTFSMMLGEIDFLGTYVHPLDWAPDEEGPRLPFPFTAYFILGLFMVLMPILLMNLLIGLAVGDIESVRRNAQLKRLAMQVVLHTELERKLPHWILEKVDKMELIEYPNEGKCKLGFMDHLLRMWFCNPFSEDGLEMVLENNEDLVTEEMTKMKTRLKDMNKALEQQSLLLKLIVQKMEIKTEADDVDEGVSPKELCTSSNGSKWTSPRVRNKLRTALSFSKSHPIK